MEINNKKTSINRVVTILILCVLICMAATIRLLKLSGWVYAIGALVLGIIIVGYSYTYLKPEHRFRNLWRVLLYIFCGINLIALIVAIIKSLP